MTEIREERDEIKTRGPGKVWFAVCGDMFDHPVVGMQPDVPWPAFVAWQWLIKEAARHERTIVVSGQKLTLKRGELAHSQRYLARRFNWSHKTVRRFLDRLERFEMAVPSVYGGCPEKGTGRGTAKGTGRGTGVTVLTICNYDTYQSPMPPRGTGGGTGRGTAKGTRGAQEGHSKGTKQYRDTENRETEKSSSIKSNRIDDDKQVQPQLSPSIIEVLCAHVGQTRGNELATQWLGSRYGRNAQLPDRAFIKWLQKTYGIVISGAGDAAFRISDALAMCPKDEHGRPDTTLPKTVTGGAADWKSRARLNGRGRH